MKKGVKLYVYIIIAAATAIAAAVIICVIAFSHGKANTTLNAERVVLSGDPSKAPQDNGELVIGVFSRARDIHPYRSDDEASRYINRLAYPPLAEPDSEGGIRYINASSIVIDNNGRQADAAIAEGVEFGDGTPLSAEAVVGSYRWFMGQETPYSALLANIDSITAVDGDTVRFIFKQASADIDRIFALPIVSVVSEENTTFVGTGAYKIESAAPDSDAVLVPNDKSAEKAEYEKITLKLIDHNKLDEVISSHAADIFTIETDEQLQPLKENMSYSVYETQEDNGYYLLCLSSMTGINDLVYNAACGRDFFDNSEDFGAYPAGIVSAYIPEPNFRSLHKSGAEADVSQLNLICGYDPISQSIAQELSARMEKKGVSVIKTNADEINAPGQDLAIYYGSWRDIADAAGFFSSHGGEELSSYYKDMEEYLSAAGNIIPLQRNTRAVAASPNKNIDDLIK